MTPAQTKASEPQDSSAKKAPETPGAAPKAKTQPVAEKPKPKADPTVKPATKPAPASASATAAPGVGSVPVTARKVRLSLTRVDPMSAMKMGFLLSVAFGIMMIVASILLWLVLNGMGVFKPINDLLNDLDPRRNGSVVDVLGFGRVISYATIAAVTNVVLSTALWTIGAIIYNMAAKLVGGFHVTLADE